MPVIGDLPRLWVDNISLVYIFCTCEKGTMQDSKTGALSFNKDTKSILMLSVCNVVNIALYQTQCAGDKWAPTRIVIDIVTSRY